MLAGWLATAAWAGPADLDATFGTDGIAAPALAAGAVRAGALARAGSGYWLAGDLADGAQQDAYLARLAADGQLDTTFNAPDGLRSIDAWTCAGGDAPALDDRLEQLAIDNQGRLLLGGSARVSGIDGSVEQFAVVRLNVDGSLDPDFGNGGCLLVDAQPQADYERITSIRVQPDGAILLAGWAYTQADGAAWSVLMRVLDDGSPDTGFAAGGQLSGESYSGARGLGTTSERVVVELDGSNRILVAYALGGPVPSLAVSRLLANGAPDPDFGNGGTFAFLLAGRTTLPVDMAVLADDRVLVGGLHLDALARPRFLVLRLTAAGAPDASFGTSGYSSLAPTTTGHAYATDLALDSAGRILLAGLHYEPATQVQRLALARFNPNGSVDESGFCSTGVLGPSVVGGGHLLVDAQDRVLVAFHGEQQGTPWGVAVARYNGGSGSTDCGDPGEDTVPDAFEFPGALNAAPGMPVQSQAVVISGISVAVPVTVANGEYSVGCTGSWTTAAGTIANGESVCVQHVAAATYSTSTVTTLTVGGVAGSFTSTTLPDPGPGIDAVPDAFSFAPRLDWPLSTVAVSAPVTVSGINVPAAISVAGGGYSIGCTGSFTTAPGQVSDGAQVCVRHISSSLCAATVTTTLTIGGVQGSFTSTTIDESIDSDGDGVSDCLDSTPTDAASASPRTDSGLRIDLSVPAGNTLANVQWLAASAAANTAGLPAGMSLPFGLLSYEVHGVTPGGSVAVTIRFPSIPASARLFKYDAATGFVDITAQATFSGGAQAVVVLVDGGIGDADGEANGVIVDPLALAVPPPAPTGGGGGGGSPGLPLLWLLALLAARRGLACRRW